MIVNEFPPTGESGVQRPLKFVKYLTLAGWKTFVVTPKNPPKAVLDHSLLQDIPDSAEIYKTHSLGISAKKLGQVEDFRQELLLKPQGFKALLWKIIKLPNDLLMPLDKQIGWVPFALFKAIQLINKHKLRNVYITAFPFSAFLIGIALKRIYKDKIFWVADYRDAWQFAPCLKTDVLKFRKRIIDQVDDRVIKSCDCAVFVTDFIKDNYVAKHPNFSSKFHVITNGYDEDDFEGVFPHKFDKYTLLFMGKIHQRMAKGLIALLDAIATSSLIDTQFLHIGTTCQEIKETIQQSKYSFFSYEGYKLHKEALEYAAGADINIIMMNDDQEAEGVYTGKLFELIRLGKPILFVGPKTTIIRDVIEPSNLGLCAYVGDVEDIIDKLRKLINKSINAKSDSAAITKFSRATLTQQLIDLFTTKQNV